VANWGWTFPGAANLSTTISGSDNTSKTFAFSLEGSSAYNLIYNNGNKTNVFYYEPPQNITISMSLVFYILWGAWTYPYGDSYSFTCEENANFSMLNS